MSRWSVSAVRRLSLAPTTATGSPTDSIHWSWSSVWRALYCATATQHGAVCNPCSHRKRVPMFPDRLGPWDCRGLGGPAAQEEWTLLLTVPVHSQSPRPTCGHSACVPGWHGAQRAGWRAEDYQCEFSMPSGSSTETYRRYAFARESWSVKDATWISRASTPDSCSATSTRPGRAQGPISSNPQCTTAGWTWTTDTFDCSQVYNGAFDACFRTSAFNQHSDADGVNGACGPSNWYPTLTHGNAMGVVDKMQGSRSIGTLQSPRSTRSSGHNFAKRSTLRRRAWIACR